MLLKGLSCRVLEYIPVSEHFTETKFRFLDLSSFSAEYYQCLFKIFYDLFMGAMTNFMWILPNNYIYTRICKQSGAFHGDLEHAASSANWQLQPVHSFLCSSEGDYMLRCQPTGGDRIPRGHARENVIFSFSCRGWECREGEPIEH